MDQANLTTTNLVNADGQTGILPSLFHGTMAFLGWVLVPFIAIIFVIFIALGLIAIGRLVRRLLE